MKRLSSCLYFTVASACAVLAADSGEIVNPELKRPIHVLVPSAIMHYDLPDYYAEFLVRVAADGRVMDLVCVEASHPGLIPRADRALRRAEFQPATEDGVPFIADVPIRVNFRHPSADFSGAVEQSGLDHIEDTLTYLDREALRFEKSSPRDLSEPLRIIEQQTTFVPTDADGEPVHGSAVIEFYVDRDGTPRLPTIVRSDHEAISDAALRNISSARFNKPRVDGRPTVVKVRMPFGFDP